MISWYRQIDSARSSLEVVSITRDYVATWSPPDLARLPEGCRPGKIRDVTDIENLHSALVEEYRLTRATGDELRRLQELTSFLVRASIRVADLASDSPRGGSGIAGSGPGKSAAPDN